MTLKTEFYKFNTKKFRKKKLITFILVVLISLKNRRLYMRITDRYTCNFYFKQIIDIIRIYVYNTNEIL